MRLSLATRNFLGYALVLASFGAVCIFSVFEMHRNQNELRLVSEGYVHLAQNASAIETLHKNHERDSRREEDAPQTRRDLIRLTRLYLDQKLEELLARSREVKAWAPSSEKAFLELLENRLISLQARYDEYEKKADALVRLTPEEPLEKAQTLDEINQLESALGRAIALVRHELEERIRQRVVEAEVRERRAGMTIIGLSVLAIALGLAITLLSARALKPIRQLMESTARVGRGDYSAQLKLRGDDDIALLAKAFDIMAHSLQAREAELQNQQQALLRAEQLAAVGRVSAQVAHEVRNPLSSIGLNTDMLGENLSRAHFLTAEDKKEAHELLATISREVDRLTAITEHYLGMARLPKPALEPEDLSAVIDSVLDFSKEGLQRARIEVDRMLEPECRALVDEGQMRQVFLNLFRNSKEAMPDGGHLTVRTRKMDGFIVSTVTDDGKGVTEDARERMFEPFYSTKQGGTGLGLAVTRQILQAHGGNITCESTPGRGTTFVVKLPAA